MHLAIGAGDEKELKLFLYVFFVNNVHSYTSNEFTSTKGHPLVAAAGCVKFLKEEHTFHLLKWLLSAAVPFKLNKLKVNMFQR